MHAVQQLFFSTSGLKNPSNPQTFALDGADIQTHPRAPSASSRVFTPKLTPANSVLIYRLSRKLSHPS